MFEIRQMRRSDISRILEIEKICFPVPWSESAYLNEIGNRSAYYTIASLDDKLIGYTGMWLVMDEAHITTLGVDPVYRQNKVGERLLISLIEESHRRHIKRMTLEVRQSNTKAQNLYKKYGFQSVAIRRGYYTDNNENAIIMWIDDLYENSFIAKFESLKYIAELSESNLSANEAV